jgi:hypothetical protein
MSAYPYSKEEGGIILSIILIIWGIGAWFESYKNMSIGLLSIGILLLLFTLYRRRTKKTD